MTVTAQTPWIARWTHSLFPDSVSWTTAKRVVLVAPKTHVSLGFEKARDLLQQGLGPVILVARGATLPDAWPAWVTHTPDLMLVEITAFREASRFESTKQLTHEMRTWLEQLLHDILPSPAAPRVYHSACLRLFQHTLDDHPFAVGCAQRLAGRTVHGVGNWSAWSYLATALHASGGELFAPESHDRTVSTLDRWKAVGAACVFAVGALAQHTREYFQSREARRVVATSRQQHTQSPRFWAGMLPTWYRMNRVLLETVIKPLMSRNQSFGTLFIVELFRGERDEHAMTRMKESDFGAGFRDQRDAVLSHPVEQVVASESLFELSASLGIAAIRSARAITRMSRMPNPLQMDGHSITYHPRDLARLVSIDVCRSTFYERATRAFVRRSSPHTAPVLLATTASVPVATACKELQNHNVPVFEILHGTAGEGWPGVNENMGSVLIVPTQADAQALQPLRLRTVVGGLPQLPLHPPRTAGTRTRNLLFMSSYLHRDWFTVAGNFLQCLQDELLRTVTVLEQQYKAPLRVRWRPHPADMPDLVQAVHAKRPSMELSHNVRPLSEDLAWCDVAITSPSSVVFEALFAGVPVFQHAEPDLWKTPVANWMSPERVFFRAEEGAARLHTLLRDLEMDAPHVLLPEHQARIALFGPTGKPVSTLDVLSALLQEHSVEN